MSNVERKAWVLVWIACAVMLFGVSRLRASVTFVLINPDTVSHSYEVNASSPLYKDGYGDLVRETFDPVLVTLIPGAQITFQLPGIGVGSVNADSGFNITNLGAVADGGSVVVSGPHSYEVAVVGRGAYQAPGVTVHVDNPVHGMEFILMCLGALVGAVVWRIIMGRW